MLRSLRGYVLAASFFGLFTLIGAPKQAFAALSGGYSCLGTFTLALGNPFRTVQFSEIMNLNLSSRTGTLTLSWFAESCTFKVTSISTVVSGTQGTLAIGFNGNQADADKDISNCGNFNFGIAGPITEHYVISTASAGAKFFFIGADPFITPIAGADSGDFFVPSGECDKQ